MNISDSQACISADVCELDYPPAVYGRTQEEVEECIQAIVERIFRDEDGIICSGVNGRTMKLLKVEEVSDRPYGIGTYMECSTVLPHFRPIWQNYENAQQASGKYIRALLVKHAVTGDKDIVALIRRTVEALQCLWRTSAETNRLGLGWMPKPYGGIRDVSKIWETSVDQYAETTLALDAFYRSSLSDDSEKAVLREMIVSFADWWIDHHYAIGYAREGTCYWKKLGYAHPIGYFLYLTARAYSFSPKAKYEDAFKSWLEDGKGLLEPKACIGGTGVALDCLERLVELRPDLKNFWTLAVEANAKLLIRLWKERQKEKRTVQTMTHSDAYVAYFLVAVHHLSPSRGYDRMIREILTNFFKRTDFYNLSRGVSLDNLDERLKGDDIRNCFWAEGHVCWMYAYWSLKAESERQ